MANYIIFGLILLGLFFAIKRIVRNSKEGKCAGCSGCGPSKNLKKAIKK